MYWAQKVRIETSIWKPAADRWPVNSSVIHRIENTVHIQA